MSVPVDSSRAVSTPQGEAAGDAAKAWDVSDVEPRGLEMLEVLNTLFDAPDAPPADGEA